MTDVQWEINMAAEIRNCILRYDEQDGNSKANLLFDYGIRSEHYTERKVLDHESKHYVTTTITIILYSCTFVIPSILIQEMSLKYIIANMICFAIHTGSAKADKTRNAVEGFLYIKMHLRND